MYMSIIFVKESMRSIICSAQHFITLMNYDKNSSDLISLVGTQVVSILYTSFIDKKGVTDKNTVGSDDT